MYFLSLDAETAIFHANAVRTLLAERKMPRLARKRTKQRRPVTERILLEVSIGRAVGFAELYLLMRATRQLCPDLLRASAVLPTGPVVHVKAQKGREGVSNTHFGMDR
jgi:hypothetical protein